MQRASSQVTFSTSFILIEFYYFVISALLTLISHEYVMYASVSCTFIRKYFSYLQNTNIPVLSGAIIQYHC